MKGWRSIILTAWSYGSMRIGIDISQIVYGTGVSVYTKNLVENLLQIDEENEYMLLGGSLRKVSSIKYKVSNIRGRYETRIWRMPPTFADILWNRLHVLNIELFAGKLDVFHSSDWTQPPSRAFKVTTIHDVAPLKFEKEMHSRVVKTHRRRLEWVKKEVDRIIVPSKATRDDLVGMGFDSRKIRVIYEGVEEGYGGKDKAEVKTDLVRMGIEGEYLLMVGTGGRKNTATIVKAHEALGEGEVKMVFTGDKPVELRVGEDVKFLGFVSDEELRSLYHGALALVYTPLYEGFGLPVLQAMASGCPVVTSHSSSLPEVAGDAAVLVDPTDPDEIAKGIKKVMKTGKQMKEKGLKRADRFSWKKMAEETLVVYKEA